MLVFENPEPIHYRTIFMLQWEHSIQRRHLVRMSLNDSAKKTLVREPPPLLDEKRVRHVYDVHNN